MKNDASAFFAAAILVVADELVALRDAAIACVDVVPPNVGTDVDEPMVSALKSRCHRGYTQINMTAMP